MSIHPAAAEALPIRRDASSHRLCATARAARVAGATAAVLAAASLAPAPASADILITEVIPNVSTNATRGDVVELFNTGPGAVDLTGWILTDLDPNPVAGVLQDDTFAPMALGLPPLQPGQFAVVDFVDIAGTAAFQTTNYGLRITAPLVAGSFLGSDRDELLLADAAHTPIDFVAWSDSNETVTSDSYNDLSALTGAVHGYGLTPGAAAWDGLETITDDAEYYANTVDFTGFSAVSTWGGGSIRRISSGGVFDVGAPDGPAQWEVVPRHRATLGNASDDVPTMGGLRPIRVTDDLASWLAQIRNSTFPERRLAPLSNQDPADFVPADSTRRGDWQALLPLAMAGQWEEAFSAGDALGYEVVEFLDTATGLTFHILRERFVPGEVGFTGMGTYVFHDGVDVRGTLVLQVPHPIFDSNTLEEGALAAPQALPRLLMIAGTHRNNHTDESDCDGTQSGGDDYRISDVAHHAENLFHATHLWLHQNLPDMVAIQFHGFCCPGSGPYVDVTDDCILSNGFNAAPAPDDFTQVWRGRIDAQMFMADGIDLTTCAVFGDDANVLGATTNLQGRVTNGVAIGDECNTAATGATGRFIHIEQDPDVREEPQHILDALIEGLDLVEPLPSPCGAAPAMDCRQAGTGKSSMLILDSASETKDRLQWKWLKGEATTAADFADPVAGGGAWHLCAWDASASSQPLVDLAAPGASSCGTKPCWKTTGTKGFGYKDKAGASDGVTGIKLGAGADGKAKILVKARGASLPTPALPLTLPVTVQFQIDDGVDVRCWESLFSTDPLGNTDTKFRAKQ
jgi:hypothetical protein